MGFRSKVLPTSRTTRSRSEHEDRAMAQGETYGIQELSDVRAGGVCQGSMSRWEATRMASYRSVKANAMSTAFAQGESGRPSTRAAVYGSGPMKRAALYARVSTDKQEREATIESQLDALHQAVQVGAYEVPAGGVFVDQHASGARLDRPALDRLRDLAAEGAFDAVLVWSPDRLARRYAYQGPVTT